MSSSAPPSNLGKLCFCNVAEVISRYHKWIPDLAHVSVMFHFCFRVQMPFCIIKITIKAERKCFNSTLLFPYI